MKNDVLKSFIKWAEELNLPRNFLLATEVKNNSSAILDIESDIYLARITCWDSGDFHAEILEIKIEKNVYNKFGSFRVESVSSDLFDFFEKLGLTLKVQK